MMVSGSSEAAAWPFLVLRFFAGVEVTGPWLLAGRSDCTLEASLALLFLPEVRTAFWGSGAGWLELELSAFLDRLGGIVVVLRSYGTASSCRKECRVKAIGAQMTMQLNARVQFGVDVWNGCSKQ